MLGPCKEAARGQMLLCNPCLYPSTLRFARPQVRSKNPYVRSGTPNNKGTKTLSADIIQGICVWVLWWRCFAIGSANKEGVGAA